MGDTSSIVSSSEPSTKSLSTAASYRKKHGVSLLARAFLFQLDVLPDWREPPVIGAALSETVSFACGQVEVKINDESAEGKKEDDDEEEEPSLVFKGYIEFSLQVTPLRIRDWLRVTDDDNFTISPAFIKDRDKLIKIRTAAETRYKGPDDLILPAPWVFGKMDRASVGARTDMEEIRELCREHGPEEGVKRVAEQFPGQFVRYANGITQLAQLVVPRVREQDDFKLRPWQAAIHKIASGTPHPRHIYWVEDGKGNTGKSRLTTYMCREMKAIELDGRHMDAAFSYTGQPIVIFDLARCIDPLTLKDLYSVAEKLKNGQIYSSKYMSRLKVFHVPHVFFFSNSPPPIGVWSADRLQHIVLSPADAFHHESQPIGVAAADEPVESGLDLFTRYLEDETKAREAERLAEIEVEKKRRDDAEDAAERAAYDEEAGKRKAELRKSLADTRKRKLGEISARDGAGDEKEGE
jgi:hypothetical protein